MTTTLYRHFDSEDRLLYVGISRDPFQRLGTHANTRSWADRVARMTMAQFDTAEAALAAERAAIQNERPQFNVAHADREPSMTSKQYREALAKLGLTQGEAAEFFGASIRTANGYAAGRPIPETTAKLLRLMLRLGLDPSEVV